MLSHELLARIKELNRLRAAWLMDEWGFDPYTYDSFSDLLEEDPLVERHAVDVVGLGNKDRQAEIAKAGLRCAICRPHRGCNAVVSRRPRPDKHKNHRRKQG